MAVQAVEQPAGTVSALSRQVTRLRDALAAIPLQAYASQSPAEARRIAAGLRELRSMLDAHVGAAVRAVERLVPTRDARQLLASDFGLDPAAAHREVRNSRVVAAASVAEQEAARGAISHTHAVVIGRALRDLPDATTDVQRRRAEQALVSDARRLAPKDLETRARRITELFVAESEVDAAEDSLLRRREAAARQRASLVMWDNRDGSWSGKFTLPELQARILKTVVDAYAAPRRTHLRDDAGHSAGAGASAVGSSMAGPDAEARGQAVRGRDDLNLGLGRGRALVDSDSDKPYDRKAGEALMALVEHLPVDGLPTSGGTPARIVITIDEQKLRSAVAAATLATGERLSAGEVRRLACTHGLLPAVLGAASVPVDLGRAQRLFSPHQRDALASLDGGCVAPGCDRPPAWCEAHHGADPWNRGGTTDLKDGYLLCSAHHHEAHQRRWCFRRGPDGRAEVDRGQGWERNPRYRPSDAGTEGARREGSAGQARLD